MTDDANILVEVDAVHLTQRTSARDGLQDRHGHRHLHISFHRTGCVLFDEHGESRNQHGVELTSHPLCKTSIVRGNHTEVLILHPLFEGHHILSHVPDFFNSTATLNLEGVEDILSLGTDSCLVSDVIGNRPHLFPVKLLGVDKHPVVEVGLIDIEVHHTRVGTSDLGNVGITESATYLCCTTPVLNLCLYLRITAFHHTSDHSMALASTLQVCHHLPHSTTGIELSEPRGDIGLLIVRCLFLLYIDQYHWYVQVTHSRQHIIRGTVGEQLQDDEVYVGSTELVTCSHRLFFRGHHPTIDNLYCIWQCLLKSFILSFKLWYELWKLG